MTTSLPAQVLRDLEEADRLALEVQEPAPTPPEPEPPAPEPEPPAPPPAPEDWKHKFETLQGIHRADNARNADQIRDLTSQVSTLSAQLAEAVKTPAPAPAPAPQSRLVTDEDKANFGEDLIDLIARKAEEVAGPRIAELTSQLQTAREENATLKGNVDTVVTAAASQTQRDFYSELDRIVPDWRAANETQEFLVWLGDVDSMSGEVRQTLLERAVASRDAPRVATIVNAWKDTVPPPPPAPTPNPDTLAARAEPGSSRATPTPQAEQPGKVWTSAEVDKFYRDLTIGAYKGRETEAQRIEADIDLASSQGRVR